MNYESGLWVWVDKHPQVAWIVAILVVIYIIYKTIKEGK